MDKFVVRTPKEQKVKIYKQVKIENLKGVVIIEDLERAKVILERTDTSAELKVDTLERLKQKFPCKEVLIKTQIGKTVHKLCRHFHPDVASAAKNVYESWRSHIVHNANKRSIEVQYDSRTTQLRKKARALLLDAMQGHVSSTKSHPKCEDKRTHSSSESEVENLNSNQETQDTHDLESLAEYIEREVFRKTQKKTNACYRKTNRRIIFSLKYKKDVKLKVESSEITAQQLVKQYFES